MKISTKLAGLAGLATAMVPFAARAQDDMTSTVTSTTDAASTAAAGTLFGGVFIVGIIIWLVSFVVGILALIFWILMIVDVFKRTNWKQESDKTLWIIIVILLGFVGAIIYYFAVKRELDAPKKTKK
jgi:hypothetical protein